MRGRSPQRRGEPAWRIARVGQGKGSACGPHARALDELGDIEHAIAVGILAAEERLQLPLVMEPRVRRGLEELGQVDRVRAVGINVPEEAANLRLDVASAHEPLLA